MKRKLLLSFAVFATALSVNAQKRGSNYSLNGVKSPKHVSVVSNSLETNNVLQNVDLNKTLDFKSTKKRGVKTVQDTSRFFVFKRSYASPGTSSTILQPYYYPNAGDATKDSIELTSCFQIIPNLNKSKVTYKGVTMQLVSLNKKQGFANVDLKVYDDKGATIAKATQKVLYSASAYGTYHFMFDKPLTTDANVFVAVEPSTANDTVRVPTSGAYRNSAISCNISGNKLTLVSPAPTTPANIGTGFWTGQEITGTGIPAGTKIVGITAATSSTPLTYTISSTLSAPVTNLVVTGVNNTFDVLKNQAGLMYLKFPVVAGTKNPDFTKAPAEAPDFIHYLNAGTTAAPNWKAYDAHITMYPIVEYTYDVNPAVDNKCLGNNKVVNVTYATTDAYSSVAKNPVLNQMAFWSSLLGWNKKTGYYYSLASVNAKSGGLFKDTLDHSNATFAYKYTAATDANNDTLVVTDFMLPYGLIKVASMVVNQSTFLLSSKLTEVTTITPVAPKCYYDKANDALSLKGYAPYTGLPKVGDAAGTFKVTDANGCSIDITTTAPIAAVPAKFDWTSAPTVENAKCFGDKAKVTVAITKPISGAYTGLIQEFATTASVQTKNIVVADPNGCRDTLKNVSIPAGPAKVVATATVTGAKCFGEEASVEVKATGGTGVITGVGIKKFSATAASTQKIEVLDANNCVATVDAAILAAPAKVVATATVTDAKCFGEEASVEVKATGGTGVITGVGIKKFSATAASTQKIEVLDANKCVATVDAAIKAAPVKLEVTTAATTATSPAAADGQATATPTGGTAPYTYAWDNTDKSTTAEIKVVKGTYNVVVKDANNCTVNGSVKVSSLSVESLSISGLSIYPNPVANELNVKFNAISAATIELVNVAGQVIASKDASEFANVTFDTATLNAGVYFVNIKVAEGVFTQKIIKE